MFASSHVHNIFKAYPPCSRHQSSIPFMTELHPIIRIHHTRPLITIRWELRSFYFVTTANKCCYEHLCIGFYMNWRRKWQTTPVLTHAWKIPWVEKPGGLQSMGSQRVGHYWATSLHFTFTWTCVFNSLGIYLGVELRGPMVILWASLVAQQ